MEHPVPAQLGFWDRLTSASPTTLRSREDAASTRGEDRGGGADDGDAGGANRQDD
jgi:hypothetical protein